MKIFLSYRSSQGETAEHIFHALASYGHDVFWDRSKLVAGKQFHRAIKEAISSSDIMVFLLTPDALLPGAYTLTELQIARSLWSHPEGRVLTVELSPVPLRQIPPYLRATTILKPEGNVAADVAFAVDRLKSGSKRPVATAIRGIIAATVHRGAMIEARASRPVTMKVQLLVDGEVVALAQRPWLTSIAKSVWTWFGIKPRWSVSATSTIDGKVVNVRADFVTTFWDEFFLIYVDDKLVTPARS